MFTEQNISYLMSPSKNGTVNLVNLYYGTFGFEGYYTSVHPSIHYPYYLLRVIGNLQTILVDFRRETGYTLERSAICRIDHTETNNYSHIQTI